MRCGSNQTIKFARLGLFQCIKAFILSKNVSASQNTLVVQWIQRLQQMNFLHRVQVQFPLPEICIFTDFFIPIRSFLRVHLLLHYISNAQNRKNASIISKYFHRITSNVYYGIIMDEATTAPSVQAPFLGDISLSKPPCGQSKKA